MRRDISRLKYSSNAMQKCETYRVSKPLASARTMARACVHAQTKTPETYVQVHDRTPSINAVLAGPESGGGPSSSVHIALSRRLHPDRPTTQQFVGSLRETLKISTCSDTMLLIYNVYVVQRSISTISILLSTFCLVYQSSSSGKYLLIKVM
jgi:hypothetical protein